MWDFQHDENRLQFRICLNQIIFTASPELIKKRWTSDGWIRIRKHHGLFITDACSGGRRMLLMIDRRVIKLGLCRRQEARKQYRTPAGASIGRLAAARGVKNWSETHTDRDERVSETNIVGRNIKKKNTDLSFSHSGADILFTLLLLAAAAGVCVCLALPFEYIMYVQKRSRVKFSCLSVPLLLCGFSQVSAVSKTTLGAHARWQMQSPPNFNGSCSKWCLAFSFLWQEALFYLCGVRWRETSNLTKGQNASRWFPRTQLVLWSLNFKISSKHTFNNNIWMSSCHSHKLYFYCVLF